MLVHRKDFELQRKYYIKKIINNIFIHPTDSHYSIGCDATNSLLVTKLRLIKKWFTQPFTVIAPNKKWIEENLEVPKEVINQLPGPITIIAKLKNENCICKDVHLGKKIIGVRIPNHWISKVVSEINKPIVSSCANKYAENLMTSIETADPQLVQASAIVIHEGVKHGKPIIFIDYTEGTSIIQ